MGGDAAPLPKSPAVEAVASAIEEIGFGPYQMMPLVLAGGLLFAEGAEMLVMGSMTSLLRRHWELDAAIRGVMVSIVFIGFALGNFVSGQIGDRLGRKFSLLLSYALIGGFGFATASSQGPLLMIVLRFWVGFGCGIGFPAAYAYLPEVAPASWSGALTTFLIGFMPLGELISACFVLLVDPELDSSAAGCDVGYYFPAKALMEPETCAWRTLCELGAIPAFIFLIFAIEFMDESPQFLASKGRFEECEQVLQRISEINGRPFDVARLRAAFGQQVTPSGMLHQAEAVADAQRTPGGRPVGCGFFKMFAICQGSGKPPEPVKALDNSFNSSPASSTSLEHGYSFADAVDKMTGPNFGHIVLFMCLAHAAKDFSYFGLSYMLPQYFVFLEGMAAGVELLIVALAALPAIPLAYIGSRMHSVPVPQWMSASAGLCSFFAIGMLEGAPTLSSAPCAYMVKLLSLSYFIFTVIYTAQAFPTSIRQTAVGVCTAAGRTGSISAPIVFEVSKEITGGFDFFILCLMGLMGTVAVLASVVLPSNAGEEPEEAKLVLEAEEETSYGATSDTSKPLAA